MLGEVLQAFYTSTDLSLAPLSMLFKRRHAKSKSQQLHVVSLVLKTKNHDT
jgi:hypothetical protein